MPGRRAGLIWMLAAAVASSVLLGGCGGPLGTLAGGGDGGVPTLRYDGSLAFRRGSP